VEAVLVDGLFFRVATSRAELLEGRFEVSGRGGTLGRAVDKSERRNGLSLERALGEGGGVRSRRKSC
jgi:hypothetical protein